MAAETEGQMRASGQSIEGRSEAADLESELPLRPIQSPGPGRVPRRSENASWGGVPSGRPWAAGHVDGAYPPGARAGLCLGRLAGSLVLT